MTSTTETETKVETAVPKDEVKAAAEVEGGDAQAAADKAGSTPGSPTKTGTLKKEPAITVHKKDFEKDVVYLYQFVRSPTTPSLSADCLKVENWLRLNQIKYENVEHKMRLKSKKGGNLPFVEFNGKEIEDSDVIIRELAAHFEKPLDDGLTNEQKMISHAFESMLTNHTGWVVRWWRYNHPQEFIEVAKLDIKRTFNSLLPNSVLNFVFKIGFKKQLKDAVGYSTGRYEGTDVFEAAKKDLKALSDCLGTNDFFFGKEPHVLDSTAFANLVQFRCVPFDNMDTFMETETPNLIAFVDRMKARCWSDWESILSTLDMNTHLPKKEPVEGETPAEGGDAAAATTGDAAASTDAAAAAEQAKKDAEAKKAEKKRLAEEKKKEREEKKKKEKEEKERIKKEKEEAAKAKKAAEAEAKAKAAEEAEKAKAEAAEKAKAEAAKAAEAAEKPAEATKEPEATANGGDAAKPAEVTAE